MCVCVCVCLSGVPLSAFICQFVCLDWRNKDIYCGGVATDGIYHNISDTDQLKCMLMDVRLSEARTH